MKPIVCILYTDGTNCYEETKYAFEKAGAIGELVHINQLKSGVKRLSDYQMLIIPGGFSYGDDIASGRVLAIELIAYLQDQLQAFVEQGKLIMGICNGFQVLVRTGLLPFGTLGVHQTALTTNDSGRFECRWTTMVVAQNHCVFTQGLPMEITLPVAHAEGKFDSDEKTLQLIESQNLVVLRYSINGIVTQKYPANPNGSPNGITGICDSTGRIFGLMPHPERHLEITHNPNWRRGITEPHGLPFFQNAVNYASAL